jgi:hypothetical protein
MSDDPGQENAKVSDLSAKRLLHDQAVDLLDDKGLFMGAVRAQRIAWWRELLAAKDKWTEDKLLAQLRALDALPQVLQGAVNDYKVAADRQRRHG